VGNYVWNFDYKAWRSDTSLHLCSLKTRGVWIEMLACMCDAPEIGKLIGTYEQIAGLCGISVDDLKEAVEELKQYKVAEIRDEDGILEIINRRMYREKEVLSFFQIEDALVHREDSMPYKLSLLLREVISEVNQDVILPEPGDTAFQDWCTVFEAMLKEDKRKVEDIVNVIKIMKADDFWSTVVTSPAVLRRNYGKIKRRVGSAGRV